MYKALYSFLLLVSFQAYSQYTISPWDGSFSITSCPTSNSFCGVTTFGNTVKLSGYVSSGNFNFVLTKCNSSSPFSTSGTFYLKSGGVCGNVLDDKFVSAGGTNSVISYPLSSINSTTTFYGVYITPDDGNSNDTKYHTRAITISPPSQPDLLLDDVSLSSTSVNRGNNVTMYHDVRNDGNGNAGSFRIRYYLSSNTTIGSSDIQLANRNFPNGLQSGYYYNNDSNNLSIPSSVSPGSYYIIPFVDADNQVSESNENNNTSDELITIVAPAAVLTTTSNVSFGTSTLYKGNSYTLNLSVRNTGNEAWSGSMYVDFSNSEPTKDLGWATIQPNTTRNYSIPFTPTVAGNNVTATAKYQTGGSGSSTTVPNQSPPNINVVGDLSIASSGVNPASGISNLTNFTFTASLSNVAPSPTPTVDIEFEAPDGNIYTETDIARGSGYNYSHSQTLQQTGTYRYRFIAYQGSRQNAATGWSNITVNQPQSITVTSPTGGNYLNGQSVPITWTSTGLAGSNISIELVNSSNNSVVGVIVDPTNNDGSYSWPISLTYPAGSYKVKVYKTNSVGVVGYSGAFTVSQPQSITVTSPTGGTYLNGQSIPISWTSTGLSGSNISIEVVNSSNNSVVGVIVDPTSNSGSYTWHISNTYPTGSYKIKVYKTGGGAVDYSGTFNIAQDPNCPNCITGVTESSFTETGNEGFCATQYLCSKSIIQSAQTSPTVAIYREDLAKIVLLSLMDDGTIPQLVANPNFRSFPADNYPSPFSDLYEANTCCSSYHRYAKVLSYLDFADGMSPFRRRASFNPGGSIARIDILQVLLEAYNIDENSASSTPLYFNDISGLIPEQLSYLKKAVALGIITNGTSGSYRAFRPNDNTTREEAFLMLYRVRTNAGVVKPTESSILTSANYFMPPNLTPENMSIGRGMEQGNFHYFGETGFAIKDIGFNLGFDFSYQSFLTLLPDEWKVVQPMGVGWTHTYNAYLFTTIQQTFDANGTPVGKPLLVVAWPDGTFDVYDNSAISVGFSTTALPNHSAKLGFGNYDILSRTGSTTYTIKKKDQTVYTFTGQGEAGIFRLSTVVNGKGNTMSLVYKNGAAVAWQPATKVIDYVQAPSGRRINFSYDGSNQVTQVSFPGSTSSAPRRLNFTYDASNARILKTYKDAKGQATAKVTSYNYDSGVRRFLLREITMPKGNKIINTYMTDGSYRLQNSRAQNGGTMTNSTSINYSGYNQSTTTGMDGISYTQNINDNGLVTNISGGAVNTQRQFANANHPTQISQITSQSISYTFDYYDNGNIKQINYPTSIGGNEYFWYDAKNNLTQHRDAEGNLTTYIYFSNSVNLQQVSRQADYNGSAASLGQSFTYLGNGLVSSTTNNEGIVSNFSYDAYGNLTTLSIPVLSLTATSTYDYASRLLTATNFKNQTNQYAYDANDNLLTERDALNQTTSYAYDDNDNLTAVTNAKGRTTTLAYDALDRLSSETFEGATRSYIYDMQNRLTEFRKAGYSGNSSKKFSYTYDPATGLLKSNGYIANINYDTKRRMNSIQGGSVSGHTLSNFGYDDLNRLKQYTDNDNKTVYYNYDKNGNVIQITYPGSNTANYTYDKANRLRTVKWNTLTVTTYDYTGSRLTRIRYGNGVWTTYTYDAGGRLTGMDTRKNNGTGSVITNYTFELDKVGNHLTENMTEPFPQPTLPQATTNYTYGNNNHILTAGGTSFGFDADGNMTSKGSNSYAYDLEDNLTTVSGSNNLSYEYDAFGNRRKATRNGVVTNYILDIGGSLANVLAETNSSGTITNNYIHGLGLIARIKPNGNIHYYHGDFRGSVVAMTDASQNITHKYQYSDFGELLNSQETDENLFRYVGTYGLTFETNDLTFMRARYYDAGIGRFNSEDPIWNDNLYTYASNNSILSIDPKGEVEYPVIDIEMEVVQYFGKDRDINNITKWEWITFFVGLTGKSAAEVLVFLTTGPNYVPGAGAALFDVGVAAVGLTYDILESVYNTIKNAEPVKLTDENNYKVGAGSVATHEPILIDQGESMSSPVRNNCRTINIGSSFDPVYQLICN